MKLGIITFFLVLILGGGATAQVAIISHKDVSAAEISKDDLMDYYAGDIQEWDDGQPIVVFDLKVRDEIRKLFFKFLGRSSSRMKSIWMKRKLSGEGDPPEALSSPNDMLKRVSETPGALGFIDATMVTDQVKVLYIIEGKT